MEERLLKVMKTVLCLETADMDLSQTNCKKWDSVHHLNLVIELEGEFDVSFEPEEIAEMKTVKRILEFLKARNF